MFQKLHTLITSCTVGVALTASVAMLHAQPAQVSLAPILSLSANGRGETQAFQGTPLIFSSTLFNPQKFKRVSSFSALTINPQNGSWANNIKLQVIDGNGTIQNWPIQLIAPPPGAINLDATTSGRLTWLLGPSETSVIAAGTYSVIALLDSTASAGATGWSGIINSENVTVQISSPLLSPTVDQQEEKVELLASYNHLLGNDSAAIESLDAFLKQQPNNIGALALEGKVFEQMGQPKMALAAYQQALQAFLAANPGPLPEPPDSLFIPANRLRSALSSQRAGRGRPNVAIQLLDQGTASPGVSFLDLQVKNTGTDFAANVVLNQLSFQTLDGTGQVTFNSLLSPRLPVATDLLAVNDSATVRIFVTVLDTVNSFALTESGTAADIFGTPAPFSQTQTISLNSTTGGPVALTITAVGATKQYGQAIPDLSNVTYSGFVNGDTPASLSGALTCTTTATQSSPVGTYPVTCSGLSSANYSISFIAGTLTITPHSLTITATNSSREYAQPNPSFSVSFDGLVNGDSASSLSGMLICTASASSTSPVGTYPITCSGLSSTNYTISYAPGQLTVTSGSVLVTADNVSRVYGQANPAFTVSYSGFASGDSTSTLSGTLNCSTTAGIGTPVGTYPITCSGLSSTNYTITYTPGQLSITPASLSVSANNTSRQYGQANPLFAPSYAGFVDGDSTSSLSGILSCLTTATPSSPVGTYAIACSGLNSTNYSIGYVPGQLSVTPAPLTITANNASRQVGQPNPAFMASYGGFVNGDSTAALSGTLSCSTTASVSSPVGTYPINCSGLTSTNYSITYLPGQLAITAAACALNVSSSVSITRSGFSYSPITKRYAQTLTVQNTSGVALPGPAYIVFDNLSSNATLLNATGSTACGAPTGSSYVAIPSGINAGAITNLVLQFADPSNATISYGLRALAGAGQP